MKCPHCGFLESKVIDSRSIEESSSIRRRRECLNCQARFNTFETIETIQIMVKKKDGSREYFDKTKMLAGIVKACQKRPVDCMAIANKVERTGKRHTFEPMNPYERRIIHSKLQAYENVTTYSIGEDPNRKIVVVLKDKEK